MPRYHILFRMFFHACCCSRKEVCDGVRAIHAAAEHQIWIDWIKLDCKRRCSNIEGIFKPPSEC